MFKYLNALAIRLIESLRSGRPPSFFKKEDEKGNGTKINLNGINNGMLHNAFNFLKRPFDYMIQSRMNNVTSELPDAYQGGVYAPEFKRIFLVPYECANNTVAWHFVDCESGRVRMYNSAVCVVFIT